MQELDGITKRMVFTIENLIDLRLNGWRGPTPPGKPRKRMRDRSKTSQGPKRGDSEPNTPNITDQQPTFELAKQPEVDAAALAAEAAAEAERERLRQEDRLQSTMKAAIDEFREQRLIKGLLQDIEKFAEKRVLRRFWSTVFDKFMDCKEADVAGYVSSTLGFVWLGFPFDWDFLSIAAAPPVKAVWPQRHSESPSSACTGHYGFFTPFLIILSFLACQI
jgi:hypothetical protein